MEVEIRGHCNMDPRSDPWSLFCNAVSCRRDDLVCFMEVLTPLRVPHFLRFMDDTAITFRSPAGSKSYVAEALLEQEFPSMEDAFPVAMVREPGSDESIIVVTIPPPLTSFAGD
jgi:hypothetical protein